MEAVTDVFSVQALCSTSPPAHLGKINVALISLRSRDECSALSAVTQRYIGKIENFDGGSEKLTCSVDEKKKRSTKPAVVFAILISSKQITLME